MPVHICAGIQYPITEDGIYGFAHSDLCTYSDGVEDTWREHLHTALDEFLDNLDTPFNGYFFVGNPWMDDDND